MARNDCRPLPPLSDKDIQRFWDKVDKTPGHGPHGDCWKWTGFNFRGYGKLTYRHYRSYLAHRIAYFLYTGKDPAPLCVCHHCDWPPCCRPEHLFAGTNLDNIEDKRKKGRSRNGALTHPERMPRGDQHPFRLHPEIVPRGEGSVQSKLTNENVREIRNRRAQGEAYKTIAERFGVTKANIQHIVHRLSWKHVP